MIYLLAVGAGVENAGNACRSEMWATRLIGDKRHDWSSQDAAIVDKRARYSACAARFVEICALSICVCV
jgi:hypothetical protein